MFQASKAEDSHYTDLSFNSSQPQARWLDVHSKAVVLTSPTRLALNIPTVVGLTSVAGSQQLRVDSEVVAKASSTFSPSPFGQMLIGWGYSNFYPRDGFRGHVYGVITGKGAPSADELVVLERYLRALAPAV